MDALEPRVLDRISKAIADALIGELALNGAGRVRFVAMDADGAVIAGWCSPDADPDDPAGSSGVTLQYCPHGELRMPVALTFMSATGMMLTMTLSFMMPVHQTDAVGHRPHADQPTPIDRTPGPPCAPTDTRLRDRGTRRKMTRVR